MYRVVNFFLLHPLKDMHSQDVFHFFHSLLLILNNYFEFRYILFDLLYSSNKHNLFLEYLVLLWRFQELTILFGLWVSFFYFLMTPPETSFCLGWELLFKIIHFLFPPYLNLNFTLFYTSWQYF